MRLSPLLRWLILLLALLFMVSSTYAQKSPIAVNVDRTELTIAETLILTVVIDSAGGRPIGPKVSAITDFEVLDKHESTTVTMSDVNATHQFVYQYLLQPRRSGQLTIPSFDTESNGETFFTESLLITVNEAPAEAEQADPIEQPELRLNIDPGDQSDVARNFLIEAEIDNPNPFLGEQISYTFRIFHVAGFSGLLRYDTPDFAGFWHRIETEQNEELVRRDGRLHLVTEFQTHLFPTLAGLQTIESGALNISGGLSDIDSRPTSAPIAVNVQPLPLPAPDTFNGAIGDFTIVAEASSQRGRVNEALTVQVTVSGQGHIQNLPDPIWPEVLDWRTFENPGTIHVEVVEGKLSGQRSFEWVLVPTEMGDYTIPAVAYSYFDPQAATYRTIHTDPIPISVAVGDAEAPLIAKVGERVEVVATDIRHIKPISGAIRQADVPLVNQHRYWLIWLLPLLLFTGHFLSQRWFTYRRLNRRYILRRRAHKLAQRSLAQAHKQGQDPYQASSRILSTYLSTHLDQLVLGLTHDALGDLLAAAHIEQPLVARVKQALALAEQGRFAPGGNRQAERDRLYADTTRLLADLEKAFQTHEGHI